MVFHGACCCFLVVATRKTLTLYIFFPYSYPFVGESENEREKKSENCVRNVWIKELLFVVLLNNKELNFSCRENDETGFISRFSDLVQHFREVINCGWCWSIAELTKCSAWIWRKFIEVYAASHMHFKLTPRRIMEKVFFHINNPFFSFLTKMCWIKYFSCHENAAESFIILIRSRQDVFLDIFFFTKIVSLVPFFKRTRCSHQVQNLMEPISDFIDRVEVNIKKGQR